MGAASSGFASAPELQALLAGMTNISNLHASVAASSAENSKWRDRPHRFLLFAQGAFGWEQDDFPPPHLNDLITEFSSSLRGAREFDKAELYKIINFVPGWELRWFHPDVFADLRHVSQAVVVMNECARRAGGLVVDQRFADLQQRVWSLHSTEWLPKQAVAWIQKALGFWLADLGRWASSPEAMPLTFPDGSVESKLEVHQRSMPRIGPPPSGSRIRASWAPYCGGWRGRWSTRLNSSH